MYYDPKQDKYIELKESVALKFLYNTIIGRVILKLITGKLITRLYSKYMTSKLSCIKINKFIKKNNINMDEYEDTKYNSFNEFFMRKIKDDKRSIGNDLIAVSDAKLTVYKIDENSCFDIKRSKYTVKELIGEDKKYKYALVFRLCVDDYHHYIYPDNGEVLSSKYIDGKLHTVQPIALKKYKVFHENSREVTYLNCDNLGDVAYIEVGALMVGKIVNDKKDKFNKGEEKGHFEFGGSTIILLINKDITINDKILENSSNDIETIVKLGENIGKW